jgi:N-methylhydantoinase B
MSPRALEAVSLEILWSRLISITNEQQAALIRTGFSTVLRESEDLACGVFDTRGWMVAQSVAGTPGHINSMATGMRHFVEAFPPETLAEGDVLITNDPWLTAGQVNDLTITTPVFMDGQVVGYFASTCHSPDIGGRMLSAEARDVFEEGLRLPITKLADRGEVNRLLLSIVRENVRTPDETVGDMFAQMTANEVGARSLISLLREFGLTSLDPLADEVVERSERAMCNAIVALPDGTYEYGSTAEGVDDEPIELKVAVTVRGGELLVDYAGSSEQVEAGINVVLNYTRAYTSFGLKALLRPDIPHNEGSFRPVQVIAPQGSILNCAPPAPVACRSLIGHLLPGMLFGALGPLLSERVMAGGADALWITIWSGRARDGRSFNQTLFNAGGTGARAAKDGLSATCFPSGVAAVPAEVIEVMTPLLVRRRALREGSGGAGRTRGGDGQIIEITNRAGREWNVSGMVGRTSRPAPGLYGGDDGLIGTFGLADGTMLPTKRQVRLDPGAVVHLELPGGAGRGSPFERDPHKVLSDVIAGVVSIEDARDRYGVAISYVGPADALVRPPAAYEIDHEETVRLRTAELASA